MKAFAVLALLATAASAAPPEIRFIGCPIYRNTGTAAKSGCWLVDDPATGTRYDVSGSPSKPDWNHAVLIEGKVADHPTNLCGGLMLDPVRASVLDAPCTRFMLEAEGFPGRKFSLPRRNVRPLYEERVRPTPPFKARIVTIPFDFDKTFIVYQLSDYYLDQAITYALDVQPARIVVTGFAASEPATVSGTPLAETPALASERAELVARAFELRGLASNRIAVGVGEPSTSKDEAFDGLIAPSYRRVEVRIEPESPITR